MRLLLLRFTPLLLLSACTSSLQELKELEPKASDFSSSLAAEYLAYSESESEQGRTESAEHFAAKGVKAAKGEVVAPDIADNRELAKQRVEFIKLVNDDMKHVAPQKAARAQMLFDCWNEQDNMKLVKDASCSEEFRQSFDELVDVAGNLLHGEDSQKTIRFIEGSSQLDSEEMVVVKEIAAHVTGLKNYNLELRGCRDVNGSGALARKRVLAVRDALIGAGVPKAKIAFAKENTVGTSGSAVILSNDKELQNSDKVDVVIISSQKVSGGAHD